MIRAIRWSCVLCLLGGAVLAQTGNPAGIAPDTVQAAPGVPAANQPNYQDQLFVRQLAQGSMAEIALGKLADRKAGTDQIKSLARTLVDDHSKTNSKLSDLAKKLKIELPKEANRDQQAVNDRLSKLSGSDFDRAYVDSQIQDHQKAALLLQWEIGSGQDAGAKALARDTLPIILGHLQLVQQTNAEMSGQVATLPAERQ